MLQPEQPLPPWPPRPRESHKGDYGRVLIAGGSRGMAGSVALAGLAALRGGAGLVTLAVPQTIQATVAGYEPSYMTYGVTADDQGLIASGARAEIEILAGTCHALACGPGLGRSRGLIDLMAYLYRTVPQPLVIDADGLNALADRPRGLAAPGGPRILTPHPGEFRRLTQTDLVSREEACALARTLAAEHQIIVVLKGHRTYITDGERDYENHTGNPGMATGGSGDVLTGLMAALLAQRFTPWQAACLAVHLHGIAGDTAASELGEVSLIASDLVRALPAAIRAYRAEDVTA